MNPESMAHLSFEELRELVLQHGYVCVTVPGFFGDQAEYGCGKTTWDATVNCMGWRRAELTIEICNNGGRQSEWSDVEHNGFFIRRSTIQNFEGNDVVYFYR